MDIKQMQIFIEVVRTESFTRAANELHLTQPMVTKTVSALEGELGIKLIERTSKSFHLTEAGERLHYLSVDLVSRFSDIYREIGDMKLLKKGNVTMAGPPATLATYFPNFLQEVRNQYPGINISLHECGSKDIKEMVRSRRVDIGIAQLPIKDPELEVRPVIHNRSVLICNTSHRFAFIKRLSITKLKKEKFISLNEKFQLYDNLLTACHISGFEPNIVYTTSLVSFIIRMVAFGEGIAVLPIPLVENYKHSNVVQVELEEDIAWRMGLVVHKFRYQSIITRTIFDLAVEYLKTQDISDAYVLR
ncbi:MAG: LysR family transcriptional regulator [Synergistaceae bacterium]|nr:LysR family transcriptional regulator [Synergistaceae bacterium]